MHLDVHDGSDLFQNTDPDSTATPGSATKVISNTGRGFSTFLQGSGLGSGTGQEFDEMEPEKTIN